MKSYFYVVEIFNEKGERKGMVKGIIDYTYPVKNIDLEDLEVNCLERYLDSYGKMSPDERLALSNNLKPFLTTFNLI